MRRITSLTCFALALLSMFAPERIAWAQRLGSAAAPVQLWDVCYIVGVDPRADRFRQPVYISGAVPIVSSADYEGIGRDFARFVQNKFSDKFPAVHDRHLQLLAGALAGRGNERDQAAWYNPRPRPRVLIRLYAR